MVFKILSPNSFQLLDTVHQAAILDYVHRFLDKLRVLVSAAKRYYDSNQTYFSMFNEFNDLFKEYNQQVQKFRNVVLRKEMLQSDLKKLRSELVGQLVDGLGDRVCLLLEVITDSENVPVLGKLFCIFHLGVDIRACILYTTQKELKIYVILTFRVIAVKGFAEIDLARCRSLYTFN